MTTTFHLWCDTDEDGGPDIEAVKREDGVPGVRLNPPEWVAWLDKHQGHALSLVIQVPDVGALGLPVFQTNRGGIRFEVRSQDDIDCAMDWSDFRKEYGVSPSKEERVKEHAAFKAGWAAAKGTLDIGGVQR